MNSRDFTKLAMFMGVVSGCLLGTSTVSAEESKNNDESEKDNNKGVLLAKSCGSSCGSKGAVSAGSRSYVADNCSGTAQPSRGYDNQYNSDNRYQPTGSCRTQQPSNGYNQPTAGDYAAPQPSQGSDNRNQQTASGCGSQNRPNNNNSRYNVAENDVKKASMHMSDEDFVKSLNAESKTAYHQLSAEGKALAQTYANSGTDKNEAIKMAAMKQSEKRASMNQSNKY